MPVVLTLESTGFHLYCKETCFIRGKSNLGNWLFTVTQNTGIENAWDCRVFVLDYTNRVHGAKQIEKDYFQC
jgi:hypothetical protein